MGHGSGMFELNVTAENGESSLSRTCPGALPGSGHAALPHGPALTPEATKRAVRSVLKLIHAATKTSEYDHIEDAYHHLPVDDKRGDALAMLVGFSAVLTQASGCERLEVKGLETLANPPSEVMCEGGPFAGDRRFEGDQCTAFFVEPRYLVTAGHCVLDGVCKGVPQNCDEPEESSSLKTRRIVRHFARRAGTDILEAAGSLPGVEAELVACKTAAKSEGLGGSDWAVFRLTGPLPGPGLALSKSAATTGENVHMLSHLANLPLKHSPEGPVRDIGTGKFEMEVDGYSGSSGAPVFNAQKDVVGIFVEEKNAVESCEWKPCKTLPICPARDCDTVPRASNLDGVLETLALEEGCGNFKFK